MNDRWAELGPDLLVALCWFSRFGMPQKVDSVLIKPFQRCLYNQPRRIGIKAVVFGENQKVPGLVLFRFV